MIAVSVHQIAVILVKLDTGLHKESAVTKWQPPSSIQGFWRAAPKGIPPSLFFHS